MLMRSTWLLLLCLFSHTRENWPQGLVSKLKGQSYCLVVWPSLELVRPPSPLTHFHINDSCQTPEALRFPLLF